jgi:hypothetical protein
VLFFFLWRHLPWHWTLDTMTFTYWHRYLYSSFNFHLSVVFPRVMHLPFSTFVDSLLRDIIHCRIVSLSIFNFYPLCQSCNRYSFKERYDSFSCVRCPLNPVLFHYRTISADMHTIHITNLGAPKCGVSDFRRVWPVDGGCLLILGTWSHLRYVRGYVLANLLSDLQFLLVFRDWLLFGILAISSTHTNGHYSYLCHITICFQILVENFHSFPLPFFMFIMLHLGNFIGQKKICITCISKYTCKHDSCHYTSTLNKRVSVLVNKKKNLPIFQFLAQLKRLWCL